MLVFGRKMAHLCAADDIIYLTGDLGAGKTTLTRGILQGLGYDHFVKSPSYTLVEIYHLEKLTVIHIDLYRLTHPEECEQLGLSDYIQNNALFLIEWPEKAKDFLPQPTCHLIIKPQHDRREISFLSHPHYKFLELMP